MLRTYRPPVANPTPDAIASPKPPVLPHRMQPEDVSEESPSTPAAPSSGGAVPAPVADPPARDWNERRRRAEWCDIAWVLTRLEAVPAEKPGLWRLPDGRGVHRSGRDWSIHATVDAPAGPSGHGPVSLWRALRGDGLEAAVTAVEAIARHHRDQLDAIPLPVVMDWLGAWPNQDRDVNKYKISGMGNVLVRGQQWLAVNPQNARAAARPKGSGAVSLVYAATDRNLSEIMDWLDEKRAGADPKALMAAAAPPAPSGPRAFDPPAPFETAWARAREYLVDRRGLPSALVDRLHDEGVLYGTHPLRKESRQPITALVECVFLGNAGAERRSTDPDGFKGSAEGTDPTQPTLRVLPWPGVGRPVAALTEAAIDAMACVALCPGCAAFSSNGAGKAAAQYRIAADLLDAGWTILLAQDADRDGDLAAQRMVSLWFARGWLAHRHGVTTEAFDAAVIGGRIQCVVTPSPHLMWLDTWQPELPVHAATASVPGQPRPDWADTGRRAKPTVIIDIPAAMGWPVSGQIEVDVGPQSHARLAALFTRARPPQAVKDWGKVVESLPPAYIHAYDRAASGQGPWPDLPPSLEWLRRVGQHQASPEACAPRPR